MVSVLELAKNTEVPNTASIWTVDIERIPGSAFEWEPKHGRYTAEAMQISESRTICWAAKRYRGPVIVASEYHHGREAMLETLWQLLDSADIVITYNGRRFDVPQINADLNDAGYPAYLPFKHIDLFRTVSGSRMRYPRKSLRYLSERWGLAEHKLDTGGFQLWKGWMAEDPDDVATMRTYNMQDVRTTEAFYDRVLTWIPQHPNLGLYSGVEYACPYCGSHDLERHGTANTPTTLYAAFRCRNCKGVTRPLHIMSRVKTRPITL